MGYTIASIACMALAAWVLYNANSYDWYYNNAWTCVSLLLVAFGTVLYFLG